MTETVEWGSGGIVKLLGFMGGLASYSVLPGYKVTDETPARVNPVAWLMWLLSIPVSARRE